MKLIVNRGSLEIVPEGAADEAYLEEVLGLRNGGTMYEGGDTAVMRRVNALGLSCWGYAEIKKRVNHAPASSGQEEVVPSAPQLQSRDSVSRGGLGRGGRVLEETK